ncbi:MAG: ABC transporter permease, partial [Lysobacterales bacterium]
MSGLGTVYKKEVRENLRDRRSLFNSVLLGPILFPILFIGLAYFASSKQQESVEKVLEVPVVGTQHAPNLVSFLEQQGVVIQAAPEDPEASVKAQESQVIIRIPEQFAEQWTTGKPAVVELIADPSRRESNIPMQRVRGLLNAYGAQIGQLRLQL